jgi:hypothetical protein
MVDHRCFAIAAFNASEVAMRVTAAPMIVPQAAGALRGLRKVLRR